MITDAIAFVVRDTGYVGVGHLVNNLVYAYYPCPANNVKASFEYLQADTLVNFTAGKIPVATYNWDFGDQHYDTGRINLHSYYLPGEYKVKLIVTNACYTDTLIKYVTIVGIRGLSNNRGGNTGTITVGVRGAGFTSIYLSKGGQRIDGGNFIPQDDDMRVI